MKYQIDDNFYLNGTKQRFKIVDINLGGEYFLCAFKDLRYAYLGYMQKRVSEAKLRHDYTYIKEK